VEVIWVREASRRLGEVNFWVSGRVGKRVSGWVGRWAREQSIVTGMHSASDR